MKYLIVLVLVLFSSSCCGAKQYMEQIESKKDNDQVNVIKHESKDEDVKDNDIIVETIQEDNTIQEPEEEDEIISEVINADTQNTEINSGFNHNVWNDLLQKHVSQSGQVNYSAFKNDFKTLRTYISYLMENAPTEQTDRLETLAFWINAYNALTIDLIIRNYPLESIKDIKDPWDQRLWKFGDKWLNLNDIEHQILRKMDEPRIHFAIVCASVSCPKLLNKAFTSEGLHEQLTNATKEFLSDTTKNQLSENRIQLSKIFKWFSKDFKTKHSDLIDFLNHYSEVTISDKAKKSFMDYNWDLNN